jgi:hypothetical protein
MALVPGGLGFSGHAVTICPVTCGIADAKLPNIVSSSVFAKRKV